MEALGEEQIGIVLYVSRGGDWVEGAAVLDPENEVGEEVGARAQEIGEGEEGQHLAPQEAVESGQPRRDPEVDQKIKPRAADIAQDIKIQILLKGREANPFQGAGIAVREVCRVNVGN